MKTMNLLILKTNIKNRKKVRTVSRAFENHPSIKRWTIDTEDVDKVLRIETIGKLTRTEVENMIRPFGFYCEFLTDKKL